MMPERFSIMRKRVSDYMGSGMSVMEMSHRSSLFGEIFAETKRKLRDALNVPDSHEILFLQGGATLQFAAIPLNLMGSGKSRDYASDRQLLRTCRKGSGKVRQRSHSLRQLRPRTQLYSAGAFAQCGFKLFLLLREQHHIRNRVASVPDTKGKTIVCDMSSDILSKPVDCVWKFGLHLCRRSEKHGACRADGRHR